MLRKVLIVAPLAVLTLAGFIGVLHMPFARPLAQPLLGLLGMSCPVRATPEEVEAARRVSARAARGSRPSPSRPALGFALDRMTRSDVDQWAKANQIACSEQQKGTVLRCTSVPAKALGQRGDAIDDVSFAFEPKNMTLVTVTTLRNQLNPTTAAIAWNQIAGELKATLGEGRLVGTPSAQYLAAGHLRTALVEYRFSDYIANVSATNLGERVAVREHYMSAN